MYNFSLKITDILGYDRFYHRLRFFNALKPELV
jgi:hypothetical protein